MGNPNGHLVHGLSKTPLYSVWQTMKQRCTNPRCRGYRWYGAKGITLCEEWQRPEPFYEWAMNNGYEPGLTIDRINPSEGYSPSNCRWISMSDQQNNKTSNHILTFRGVSHTLTEWSSLTGIPRTTITNRLKLGWSIEEALTPGRRARQCV